jgi:hypothetical protein
MNASTRTAQGSGRHDADTPSERTRDTDVTRAAVPEKRYERVDLDRYIVYDDEGPVGYVEAVAPVFVCYVGHPYPHACEVAQIHDFHRAVATVREISLSSRHPKIQA